MLPTNISIHILQYSEYKQQKILEQLLKLRIPEAKIEPFIQNLELAIKYSMCDILDNYNYSDLYSLLRLLMEAQSNGVIRNRVVLSLLDNAVQCLEGQKLKKFVSIFIDGFRNFHNLNQAQMYRIHRILNVTIKKLPVNSEMNQIRGQIHLKIAQMLGFGHLSGLKYQKQPRPPLQKCMTVQQFQQEYNVIDISYKFYHCYYSLYKCLYLEEEIKIIEELHESMIAAIGNFHSNCISNVVSNNKYKSKGKKQDKNVLVKKLLANLTNIQNYISQILEYIKDTQKQQTTINLQTPSQSQNQSIRSISTECSESKQPEALNLEPIPHYLSANLPKDQFRLILIIQVLNYCEYMMQQLRNKKQAIPDNQNNNNSMIDEIANTQDYQDQIQTYVSNIKVLCQNYITTKFKGGQYGKLLALLEKFYVNQTKWILLKYNYKVAKKTIFNILSTNTTKNNTSIQTENQPAPNTTYGSIEALQKQFSQQIKAKLCIRNEKMIQFLSTSPVPKITKMAQLPNIRQCLSDCMENIDLHQEQDRNYVHIDKWKARRWASRYNVKFLDLEYFHDKKITAKKDIQQMECMGRSRQNQIKKQLLASGQTIRKKSKFAFESDIEQLLSQQMQ